jgi:hypothetical protein
VTGGVRESEVRKIASGIAGARRTYKGTIRDERKEIEAQLRLITTKKAYLVISDVPKNSSFICSPSACNPTSNLSHLTFTNTTSHKYIKSIRISNRIRKNSNALCLNTTNAKTVRTILRSKLNLLVDLVYLK